jgi:hypothetical protein
MTKEFGHRAIANVEIEHERVTRTLQDWARVLNVPYPAVRMRYKRGRRSFAELFSQVGLSGVTTYAEDVSDGQVMVTHQSRTFLDDIFPPEVVHKLREVGKQANLSPLQVVQKIVSKKIDELIPEQPKTN